MCQQLSKTRPRQPRRPRRGPAGKVLILVVLTLPILLGMTGLVADGGFLMTTRRKAQNAADMASLAGAMKLLQNKPKSESIATAIKFAKNYNGLNTGPDPVVNIPPLTGLYAGNANFVEVIATVPVSTVFIQILNVGSNLTVSARAVAGIENVNIDGALVALDPGAIPGMEVTGAARLIVNGGLVVNSQGGGVDASGNAVPNTLGGYAAEIIGNASIQATFVRVVGGVNNPGSFPNLTAAVPPVDDPLLGLPIPTTSSDPNHVSSDFFGDVTVHKTSTLLPGVYTSIKINGTPTVTFNPGVYILKGGGLSVNGGATLQGTGVMFYNTGSDFNVISGAPDTQGGGSPPSNPTGSTFGSFDLGGNAVFNVTPINDASSPFNGMSFYQRRANTMAIKLTGTSGQNIGTFYAKWAQLQVSGNAELTVNGRLYVGSYQQRGSTAHVTIIPPAGSAPQTPQVFLVE